MRENDRSAHLLLVKGKNNNKAMALRYVILSFKGQWGRKILLIIFWPCSQIYLCSSTDTIYRWLYVLIGRQSSLHSSSIYVQYISCLKTHLKAPIDIPN